MDNDTKIEMDLDAGLEIDTVEHLIQRLKSPKLYERESAATNLGLKGDPKAVDALIKVIRNDPEGAVRGNCKNSEKNAPPR